MRKALPTKLTGLKNLVRGLHGARGPVVGPRATTRGGRGECPGVALLVKRRNSKWSLPPPGGGGEELFDSPRDGISPCRSPVVNIAMINRAKEKKILETQIKNTLYVLLVQISKQPFT